VNLLVEFALHPFYLIRHGETVVHTKGVFAGASDVGLSRAGHEQMQAVANALASKPLQAVYSSPLRRAAEPARELAAARGIPHREIMDFAEIDFGDWEGKLRSEIEAAFPDQCKQAAAGSPLFCYPNGEGVDYFRRRVQSAFAQVVRVAPGAAAIYAHGGSIRMILAAVMGIGFPEAQKIDLSPGGISTIEPRVNAYAVAKLNDYSHLPPLK
jgi:alpha-ribazole phosphatase